MTLVQLRHLISLAQSGSFSRSAEALFLTQPALSRSIRALEDELGQPLFDRVGRRSVLTPFGRDALQRARQLVFDADELPTAAADARGRTGTVRIGMGSGPGAMLMTPLLRRWRAQRRGARGDRPRGRTECWCDACGNANSTRWSSMPARCHPAPDLQTQPLREMRGAFMVRRGHPLTRWAARCASTPCGSTRSRPRR